jgi:hypothetical protein
MFESREEIVKKVIWDGENNVTFEFINNGHWHGAKQKDFWGANSGWEKRIISGSVIRLWTVQWSNVIGFELFEDGKWVSVWCCANNFETKAETEKSKKQYRDFIEREGKKIAGLIDKGLSLVQIDKKIDGGHSGNTYGWALNLGIRDAKNRENAEKVRKEHNKEWGIEDSKGLVNPAVFSIGVGQNG